MTADRQTPQPWPNVTGRQVAAGTLVVAAIAAGFWLLLHHRIVVFSLFEAMVIGTAITPAVEWLYRRGVPRPVGVVLIYLGLLALLAAFVLLVVPLLSEESATIGTTVGGLYSTVLTTLRLSPSRLIRRLAWRLPPGVSMAPDPLGAGQAEAALDAVARAFQVLGLASRGFFVVVAVLLLAFYWTLDRDRILRSLLRLFPMSGRDALRGFFSDVENKVGGYIRGVALLCLIVGGLALSAYLALGLPYAFLLALAAGIFEAVPVIGPAIGVVPAVLVTLAVAPDKLIWVLVIYAGIQAFENTFLVPRVMSKAVGVSPLVALLALIAFGALFGAAGALLAIPLAAVVQLLLDRFVLGPEAVQPEAPEQRDRLGRLRYEAQSLVQDARNQQRQKTVDLDDKSDEVEDEIEALAADLDSLLAQRSTEANTGS